jgi:hypothetical protein
MAWSSRGVASAEISVDNGLRFAPAALEPRRGWAWQRFSLPWLPTLCGEAHLRVHAHDTDCAGQRLTVRVTPCTRCGSLLDRDIRFPDYLPPTRKI